MANPWVPTTAMGAGSASPVTSSVPPVILTGSAETRAAPRNMTVAQTTTVVTRDIENLPLNSQGEAKAIVGPFGCRWAGVLLLASWSKRDCCGGIGAPSSPGPRAYFRPSPVFSSSSARRASWLEGSTASERSKCALASANRPRRTAINPRL